MTIMRALDSNGDWMFGKGQNDYLSGNAAVAQDIKTALLSFLGNCFFAINDGVDWFNLLSSKNKLALNLAVSGIILNRKNVTGLLQLSLDLSSSRIISISYNVQTTYSTTGSSFQYDIAGSNLGSNSNAG